MLQFLTVISGANTNVRSSPESISVELTLLIAKNACALGPVRNLL